MAIAVAVSSCSSRKEKVMPRVHQLFLACVVVIIPAAILADDRDRIQAGDKHQATVTNVDLQTHMLTVKMKDRDGKDVQRTFNFEPNSRFTDENGKTAQWNSLKAGDQVSLTEKQGQLQQLTKVNPLGNEKPDQARSR